MTEPAVRRGRAGAPQLWGWGRVPRPGREVRSEDLEALTRDAVLCRGLGRSYGDSSLPPPSHPVVAATPLADRILSFHAATGTLRAEAGLSLREINRVFLPRGFYDPVCPGTQFITLGGMVAADVHGKAHHRTGSFGNHLLKLRMRVADGRILECSREVEPDLFRATVGGMGLTGHVLEVECSLARVPSSWIYAESERIPDIDRFVDALKESGGAWPYTMGWIDCLSRGAGMGRGLLMRGRWAEPSEAPPRPPPPLRRPAVPFVLPEWVLNRWSVRAFNALYYRKQRGRSKRGILHPEAFFYPLDAIGHWNRMYGRRGFTQYQCVLPESAGRGAARRFLERLTARGGASMLCVIKDCGDEGFGLLSFPLRGISIALDIPVRDDTPGLVDALNELVIAEGGRVYLAKDQFTRPERYRAMEPRLPEWTRIRRAWDAQGRLRSAQSVRLLGDRP
ncbi:MAG TPA: FAD-binding oxidoreductase [Vicinamibacteria bacterium]|nr:FAD-binding oxidoreductase [Vicinamibacteria bacterium]